MKVSVIIPTFERPKLTIRAYKSVLEQTYKNLEIFIVNDGSKDDYSELKDEIKLYQNTYYIESDHRGVSSARNIGINNSTGELIAFLDSDDLWGKDKIVKQVNYLNNNPEINLVHSYEKWIRDFKIINIPNNLKPTGGDIFLKSLNMCSISPSTALLRRDVFNKYGYFDEELRVCEDYDLWLRITAFEKIGLIEDELSVKYSGPNLQLSKSEMAFDRFRVYSLLKFYYFSPSYLRISSLMDVLFKKINILRVGAVKRDLQDEVIFYDHLVRDIKTGTYTNNLENIKYLLLKTMYFDKYKSDSISYDNQYE